MFAGIMGNRNVSQKISFSERADKRASNAMCAFTYIAEAKLNKILDSKVCYTKLLVIIDWKSTE